MKKSKGKPKAAKAAKSSVKMKPKAKAKAKPAPKAAPRAAKVPKKVLPVPKGYHNIQPYLCVKGAAAAIEFYKKVFGAVEQVRMGGPDGRIMHGEIRIGDSVLMLSDEIPEIGNKSPAAYGGSPASVFVYAPNVDDVFKRAEAAGAKVTQPLADMFWGDRFGKFKDPFGHDWGVATHIEDVTPEEMKKRMAAARPGAPS